MERIEIKSSLCKLIGSVYSPKNKISKQILIGITGKGGPKERFKEIGEALSQKNITTISFDFSGRGESVTTNPPTTAQQIIDLKNLLTYAKENYPDSELNLIATSMGALSACALSEKFNIKRIILVAPAIMTESMMKMPFTEVPGAHTDEVKNLSLETFVNSPTIQGIKSFTGQVVLVKLLEDELIPTRYFDIFRENSLAASELKYFEIPGTHGILHDEDARPGLISLLKNLF